MRIIAFYGSGPVAAYTIAIRMIEFVILPAWGLGNAAATMVGQNLGAGLPDRAEASAWKAGRYNLLFMTIVGLATFVFAPQITGLFSSDPEVLRYGTSCLRILGIGYPAYALGMVMSQAINGAGDTMTPTTLNLIAFWLVQIPLAYWLAEGAGLGPNGVFTGIVVGESLLTVMAVIVFRRGHWKTVAA
jgi:Na+-driven multidrug efflux pump